MSLVSSKGNNWTKTKFALVITTDFSRERSDTSVARENIDAILLSAENSMRLSESWKIKFIDLFSVQLNQFYVFTEISPCSKDFKKDCASLLLTRLTAEVMSKLEACG